MKLESAISSINRIIRQTVKTFGINTGEYQEMKYLVESIGEHMDLFIHTAKNEPIRISKSRMALTGLKSYQRDIEETLQAMREKGTMLQQVKAKYDPAMTSKRLSSPIDQKRIHQLATQRSAELWLIPDWYASIDDIEDPKLQAAARKMFSDCKGLKGESFEASANRAISFVRECLMNEEQALKGLNMGKSKTLGGSANLAEALARQK